MNYAIELECTACRKKIPYRENEIPYLCSCGGNLDFLYDYDGIKKVLSRESLAKNREYTLWRYEPLYPIHGKGKKSPLHAGWSPLYKSDNLAAKIGIENLYLKDEGRNPSGSLKDRAGSIVLAFAMEHDIDTITGASTGNAGSSMACLCASVGISPVIFVPYKAPKAKIAQLLLYGARVLMVKGSYDEAFELCLEFSKKYGWFNRNTGYNPFTREGKKSCSFEICEQMGWNVPEWVLVSVGDGNIISGLWKGFKDLKKLNLIDRLPRLCAVQSEKSNAVFKTFKNYNGRDIKLESVCATTIADSISVDLPRDGLSAVKAIIESEGTSVEVSDESIISAIKLTAQYSGVFAEPAGAASVAGLQQMLKTGCINSKSSVLCVLTGNGLKDIDSALKASGNAPLIEPSLKSAAEALEL